MNINHISTGRSRASIRDHCERMHLAANGDDEAAFLAALLRAMVSGGAVKVTPSWGGPVEIEFPASDGAGRPVTTTRRRRGGRAAGEGVGRA